MKTKLSMQKIGKYLRDLSIVVAGIAVTLFVNDRIMKRNEKKDLKLYLTAIKLELEKNIKYLDDLIKDNQISVDYADYLKSHDKKTIKRDTLDVFRVQGGFYSIRSFPFGMNAFEMFKSSGMMRLVNDKELLLSIWGAYGTINSIKELLDYL
jgi:hypothetical protein